MADILNLISTSSQNNEERYKFIQDLLVNKSDVPFDKEEVTVIQNTLLSLINNQLNYAATRHEGLKLLLKALPRCSKDTLIKYAVLWLTKAIQVLETAQNDPLQVTTAAEVIAKLVISCKEIPELQKQISMQNVKQLIAHANNLPEERRFGAIFYLVAVLLYHYPEPSERLQGTIKKLILPLVDSGQDNLVNAGAKCFALLTLATERAFQPQAGKAALTAWIYSQILICNSLHETMDALFSGVTEIEHVDVCDNLSLPSIPQTDVVVYYLGLERRFNNLCVYLGSVLRGCGTRNSVSPNNIFKVLSRGLFVTPAGLGNENEFRKQILHLILPNLHVSLLRVLDAFITGFGRELVPYAQTILQLLRQIFTWTETVAENAVTLDGSKPFKNTRMQAYKSLSTWLTHSGVLSGLENVCEEFLSHILKDIVPEKNRVVLSVQKTHNMSKRALKRHRENQFDNNLAQTNVSADFSNPLTNADLTEEALLALQNIVSNTGCRLKLSFYETLQSVVVTLLNDCYLGTHDQTFYKHSSNCRRHLLKTLKILQLNPHPLIPSPIQYSSEIFQTAERDADLDVAGEAKIGLMEIEKIVHPAAPTLKLPILVDAQSPENDENELDAAMDSTIRSEAVENSVEGAEQVQQSCNPIVEVIEEDKIVNETSISSEMDRSELVGKIHTEDDKVEIENSSSSLLPSEITFTTTTNCPDNFNKSDDCKVPVLEAEVSDISVKNQGDFSTGTRSFLSTADEDEPVVKKQLIEITESPAVTTSEEKPVNENDSDDDTAMLNLFCDTPQESK